MAREATEYELHYKQRPGDASPRLNRQQAKSSILRNLLICLREMFGTAVYVFVGCMASEKVFSHSVYSEGLTYAVLQAAAEVSGTGGLHLNPAITTGVTIAGKMSKPLLIIPMIFAQFLGCLIGAGLQRAALPEAAYMSVDPRNTQFYTMAAYPTEELVQLCFGEAVLTCILVTVFIRLLPRETSWTTRSELQNMKYIHALFVGLTIIAFNGLLYRSFGHMNPFRAFGQLAVLAGEMHRLDLNMTGLWKGHWVNWVGPILGAVVAGVIDRISSKLLMKSRRTSEEENSNLA